MGIFHRYRSEIHGNYRRAYLRCGLATGALLAAYLLVRLLMGSPAERPVSLVGDMLLLVALFLFTAYYRNALPERKISFKEAMLFGLGLSAVAAAVYGVSLWGICTAFPQQLDIFVYSMAKLETYSTPGYWAAWWGLYSGVLLLLLGGFGSFLAAVFFRNEKSEVWRRGGADAHEEK